MKRLGLAHLLNEPDHVQREALLKMHAELETKHQLQQALKRSQPTPKSK